MTISSDKEYPRLMRDSSENDGKIETMFDYILSWSVRFAETRYAHSRPTLNQYCRHILDQLTEGALGCKKVQSVEVWKQWNKIDLCIEATFEDNEGKVEKHAILVENKGYTNLHDSMDIDGQSRCQLKVYKKKFDDCYNNHRKEGHVLHYALISCFERLEEPIKKYINKSNEQGFKLFAFDDLVYPSLNYCPTESDIFNEFWLMQW